MKNIFTRIVLVGVGFFAIQGCSTDAPRETVEMVMQSIALQQTDPYAGGSDTFASGNAYSLKFQIDSNGTSQLDLYFSLIPASIATEIDDNSSNDSIAIDPDVSYPLADTRLTVLDGKHTYESIADFPLQMPKGRYKIIGYLSGEHSQKNIVFPIGDVYIGTETYLVNHTDEAPKIVIDSFAVDNDVLLLTDDNNGAFQATASLRSEYVTAKGIELSACLEIDGTCTDLGILSRDGNYTSTYPIESVQKHITNIALNLKIPDTELQNIKRTLRSGIHQASVIIEAKAGTTRLGDAGSGTYTATVSSSKSTTISLYRPPMRLFAPRGKVTFDKTWSIRKMRSKFGAQLSIQSQAGIDLEHTYASSQGDLLVRILGHDVNFLHLGIDGNLQYDSFDDTGIETSVKFCGFTIQEIKDLNDNVHTSVSTAKDIIQNGASIPRTWKVTRPELKKIKFIKIPANATEELKKKIAKANLQKVNISLKNAKRLTKPYSITKSKSYHQEFMLSVVPVTVEAGAGGEFGYTPSLGLVGITKLESGVEISAGINGFASAGVGVGGILSAGVEADFGFVEESLDVKADLTLAFDGNESSLFIDGNASFGATNTVTGPHGSLSLYAEYTRPKICAHRHRYCTWWNWRGHCTRHHTYTVHYPCGIKTYRPTKSLFDWKSFAVTNELARKTKRLFRIPLY